MLFFERPVRRSLLLSLTAAASCLALSVNASRAAAPVAALQVSPRGAAGPAPVAAPTILKRLPAGNDELTLRGESASRTFTVQLSRTEAARTTTFQIALLNAISLLPERSIVKLTINGTVLAAVQAGSPDKPALLPVRIPPGLLVPGANVVRVSSVLTHRVDCSVQATYELWAKLEPTQTGLLVPRDAALPIRSLDELGLEPLAPDGTTRIHIRAQGELGSSDLEAVAGLVNAVTRRAGLVRPVVDVGPEAGQGAGFDVVVSSTDGVEQAAQGLSVARSNGVTIGRDTTTSRLVVILPAGFDSSTLPGPMPGKSAAQNRTVWNEGFHKTLAELGSPTEVFSGRHYDSKLDITLPPDFLASNDRAKLLLDGTHSGSLVEGSALVFRVNGTLVSTMPLSAGKAERFQHAIVELPLRFFHPGHNEIGIEGTTSTVADAQCDTATMSREARLSIAGSSELDFPSFAHLTTLPQIPAALALRTAASDGTSHLYIPGTNNAVLGAGLTVLANMAASQDKVGTPQLHIGMPAESDPPGIVVGAGSDLPEYLRAALSKIVTVAPIGSEPPAADESLAGEGDAATGSQATAGNEPSQADADLTETHGDGYLEAAQTSSNSIVAEAQSLLRDRGFFFGGSQEAKTLPVTGESLIIAAVARQAPSTTIGGLTLPQVTRDPSHWLVVTAADQTKTQSALGQLVESGQWSSLRGEAVAFDPKTSSLQVTQPRTVSYVLPERLVVSDLRPILGGVMSDNILLSIAAMFAVMIILGLSTHVVISRSGTRCD